MTSPPGCDDGDGAFAVPAAAGIREPVLNWLQRSKGIRWYKYKSVYGYVFIDARWCFFAKKT